jgi:hypothetical protein
MTTRAQNYKIVAPQRYDGSHGGVAFNVNIAELEKTHTQNLHI